MRVSPPAPAPGSSCTGSGACNSIKHCSIFSEKIFLIYLCLQWSHKTIFPFTSVVATRMQLTFGDECAQFLRLWQLKSNHPPVSTLQKRTGWFMKWHTRMAWVSKFINCWKDYLLRLNLKFQTNRKLEITKGSEVFACFTQDALCCEILIWTLSFQIRWMHDRSLYLSRVESAMSSSVDCT